MTAQDEKIRCQSKEQTRQDMRKTREDIGILLETVREMALPIAQMQKRLMDETPLVPS